MYTCYHWVKQRTAYSANCNILSSPVIISVYMVISIVLLTIGASPRGDEEKEGRVEVTFKASGRGAEEVSEDRLQCTHRCCHTLAGEVYSEMNDC